jgi:hypothetical protein
MNATRHVSVTLPISLALAVASSTVSAAPSGEAVPSEDPRAAPPPQAVTAESAETPELGPKPEPEAEKSETATAERRAEPPQSEKPGRKERSWTDYIRPKADLRYRIELIDEHDKELRYRHRIRARVGLVGQITDTFEATAQVGTGSSDDPVSNNQSLTEAFSSKPLWLDLGYFHWHPKGWAEGFHLWGGKMENPFLRVGGSELLFDPDLNPEGLSFSAAPKFTRVEPFVTGGTFFVEERKEDDDSWLYGAQLGLKVHIIRDRLHFLAGGGYFNFTNIAGNQTLWDPTDSFGNTAIEEDPALEDSPLLYQHDYDIVEGYGEFGGKITRRIPWAAFGSVAYNYAIDDDNLGWLTGALLGQTEETYDFFLRYIYRQVQSDYTVGIFTDSDFIGGGTGGTGHEWNAGFVVYKPLYFFVTYFYNRTPFDDGEPYHRAQFDFKLKF